ncbi:hypothetical protein [Lysinibacillus sp. NPDC056232]
MNIPLFIKYPRKKGEYPRMGSEYPRKEGKYPRMGRIPAEGREILANGE